MICIAIDGPAGVGKSSVSRQLADEYGLAYLDTGAMYRAATWWCLKEGVALDEPQAVVDAVRDFLNNHVTFVIDPQEPAVVSDDEDVTSQMHSEEVSAHVSQVAAIPQVRELLIAAQRKEIEAQANPDSFSQGLGIVAEGRDITTVVAPRAEVRVLLTASEEVRQARRNHQAQQGQSGKDDVATRDAADSQVNNFTSAAEGVITIDNTHMDLQQTLDSFRRIVDQAFVAQDLPLPDAEFERLYPGEVLSDADLEEYELSDEDRALLSGGSLEDESLLDYQKPVGVLAVVGRPNVGKSTLVNRILGRKAAVVENKPGVTRDRVSYEANWNGSDFLVVDTGGWEAGVEGIDSEVANQAEIAVELADAVLLVVDAQTGLTDMDQRMVRMLRKSKKPVTVAVNKLDDVRDFAEASDFWRLGMGEPYPISAMHGKGVGDLLDACMTMLKNAEHTSGLLSSSNFRRVALIGKPNVGKSSLLNQLSHSERAVVTDIAGTTRDPIDEVVEIGGKKWQVIDTAGIKRHMNKLSGAEYYSSLRTQAAIERAELCLVLFDVSQPISVQDLRVMSQAVDAGRAIVIVFNKWDLLDTFSRARLERLYESEFTQVTWAQRVNLSAKTGWHTNRLADAMNTALNSWDQRISTSKLNSFLGKIQQAHPHPLRGGKQPRILFATQAGTRPPRFVIFTTGFLDPGYRRYLEHQLRETFGFEGTPIQISVRVREKRKNDKRR